MLIAFIAFRDAQCEIVVLEVGMGGRLDATNIVKPIAALITPIGLDHTEYLGTTLEEIAPEELPLFGPTSEAYFDPARGTPAGAKSDEMLGFGVDAAAAMMLVTPVALEAAKSVVGYVIGELQSAFKDEARPMIQALVRRLLHGGAKPAGAPEGKAGEAGGQAAARPAARRRLRRETPRARSA